MRIVVLVKQVPSTDKVKMDVETGIMVRSATEAELNPLDTYAVEEAVRQGKDRRDGDHGDLHGPTNGDVCDQGGHCDGM